MMVLVDAGKCIVWEFKFMQLTNISFRLWKRERVMREDHKVL